MNKLALVDIGSVFGSPFGRDRGFADFVSVVLFNVIALASVLLLILIIYGSITIIAGAGSGNKEDVGKGRKAVTSALVGFLIIFVSYWIIYLLQRILGFNILQPFQPL